MTQASGPTIACNLDALTAAERRQRAELAARIRSLSVELAEFEDGYALRLACEPGVARHALEWILLERRCCPFLRFELVLEAERGPLWVRLGGASGVKEFLKSAGLGTPPARQSCEC
jgi:hypothetical protein